MTNEVVKMPPKIIKCKECGEKIEYTPPYCTSLPKLVPATPKGWIKMMFGKKKKKEEKEKKEGVLYLKCPICGADLEELKFIDISNVLEEESKKNSP